MVVSVSPIFSHLAPLIERGENVAIQHLGSESAVEAFDIGVLCWLSWLDVNQLDTVLLCPLVQSCTDKFRPVVQAQPSECATQFNQLIKRSDDAL